MRLDELPIGQKAVIISLKHQGPRLQRLLEMGLFEGSTVTLLRKAPLGDPLEFQVHDFKLSMRVADAALIEVA